MTDYVTVPGTGILYVQEVHGALSLVAGMPAEPPQFTDADLLPAQRVDEFMSGMCPMALDDMLFVRDVSYRLGWFMVASGRVQAVP